MVLEEVLAALPTDVFDGVLQLIFVLKAVGIAAIVYVVYMVTMGIFNYRKLKKIEGIEKKIDLLDKKINKIVKKIN